MKKNDRNYYITLIGLLLTATGLYLVKAISEPKGIMQALPYVLIGIGCGAFGNGTGNIIRAKAIGNRPELKKRIEIEENDERNILISNQAKAKAYDLMIFVFGALLLTFVLMGMDLIPVLLLVFAYLFVVFSSIYYRSKYEKKM